MTLSARDLSLLEIATRALLSPLAAADAQHWLAEAGDAVRTAIGGTGVVLQMPPAPGASPFFSHDAGDVATGSAAHLHAYTADRLYFTDPVVDAWHTMRQSQGYNVFSWAENMQMVRRAGLDPDDSPIIKEVLEGHRFHDFAGMIGTTDAGETMIWVLHHHRDGFALGDQTTALMRVLYPAFQAGLVHLAAFGARFTALDTLPDAAAVFDLDGRLLHRNPALERLLGADVQRGLVDAHLLRLGRSLALHAHRRVGPPPPASVATEAGTYALQASFLPGGAFGPDASVLVSVTGGRAPAPPSAEQIRQQHGLTRREAEVALLLAEGLSNAQIAERAFISAHTARHHVENVMAKLDVRSRAAVAARLVTSAAA